jgi:hypothetical protein
MTHLSEFVRRVLILAIATAAALQWAVVTERIWAAIWAWYKFAGFGGGGHIVVGRTTQMVFFLGSTALAVVGYLLSKAEAGGASKVWRVAARYGWLSIVVCTVFWAGFLLTPLVALQPKS